ncbi:DNA glycosylase [Penicillium expansum]|uniref:DNA glycosylase n=1 Tax=Penicillium expansum TaxID=27334 RepID=A0A0A2J3B6_PENEN|nr:DNA glycosylase [Penicillium expansum]KGO49143.1 DNA glycosylase [Penicillium expansum]KGO61351.1 DNA glycosylase [Penicillium expansum]KGO62101.1 DNA glycosylase [Penicillium expansum]
MERRITRSATQAAAALIAGEENSPSVTQAPNINKANKRKRLDPTSNSNTTNALNTPKIKTINPTLKQERSDLPQALFNELPHNLGSVPAPLSIATEPKSSIAGSDKENQTVKGNQVINLATELQDTVNKATTKLKKEPKIQTTPTGRKPKKNTYGLTPGVSPFPELVRPTAEECEDVNRLLSSIHGVVTAPATIPEPSLTVTGCGEVPSVLDALIRTLLSGATTGNNAAKAFGGLVQRFGILSEGIGKGSVNWEAVRQATVKDVFEAIKSGGLADIKSKNLKAILDIVHEDNQARRATLLDSESKNDSMSKLVPEKAEKDKQYEIACADQNFLSLNHLHNLSTEEAMTNLIKYPGIGPKTAACVILFCLQRPCFAVDTHIFRLCRWLGWIPARANEVTAFSHLEVRIPDYLKYSLHQLFIRHGKTCPRCRAATGESSAGWEDGCVIDHLLIRDGKRKGSGPTVVSKKKAAAKSAAGKRKRMNEDSEETEESESSISDETSSD